MRGRSVAHRELPPDGVLDEAEVPLAPHGDAFEFDAKRRQRAVHKIRAKPEKGTMQGLQAFQIAAREGGFVVVTESEGGTVLWLKKSAPDSVREAHQRMCIDSLTNSVTVYWMAAPGKVNSKTFRAVPALQEWFKVIPQTTVQR